MTRTRLVALISCLISLAALVGGRDSAVGGTIHGRVFDAAGEPVSGAAVYAAVYTASRTTPSDAEGRFEVWIGEGYPVDTDVHLLVRAAGYVGSKVEAPLGATDVRVTLERGAGVRGTLVAPEGESLPAPLTVLVGVGPELQSVTALDGVFETTGLPPGPRQRVTVRVRNFVPHVLAELELESNATLDLGALALDPGATLEVRARDAFGDPVENALVEVRVVDAGHLSWDVRTDVGGAGRVRALPPMARLNVYTSPPETFGRAVRVERVGRELTLTALDTTLDVVLQRPVHLRGRLEWSGPGPAPWLDLEALEVVAVASAPEDQWRYSGAVPGSGVPLGELEAVEFVVWGRPGTWDLAFSVHPPARDAEYVGALSRVEIPVPARGLRSGELDLGVVRVGLR